MNEKNTSKLKDYIWILMGLVISIAGIIYIIVQYNKLISEPSLDEENEHSERMIKRVKSHFKQIHSDEGTRPELIDEGDLSIEIQ